MSTSSQTYNRERFRSLFTGLLEVLWQPAASVILLVAIRVYDAPYIYKAIIPASGPLGFILTPLTLMWVSRTGARVSRIAAGVLVATGGLLLLSAASSELVIFVLFSSLAHIAMVQHVPLLTQLYSTNFDSQVRGQRVSTLFLITGAVSAVVSYAVGVLLDRDLSMYSMVVAGCATAGFVSAACIWRVPSQPLNREQVGNAWRNLSLAWEDKLFGWMLTCWMLMGFGNLVCLPLRTEVMANPEHGINATNEQILLITATIPLITRLLTTRLFGTLFDRWNLIHLRILLNSLFLLATISFFNTRNLYVMGFSMAVMGAALGGGRLAWSLWVTKLAPPDKTSAYMSVHMLTTGLRGTVAPFAGFYLIQFIAPATVSYLAGGMIAISTLMFIPAIRAIQERTDLHATPARPPAPTEADRV